MKMENTNTGSPILAYGTTTGQNDWVQQQALITSVEEAVWAYLRGSCWNVQPTFAQIDAALEQVQLRLRQESFERPFF